MPVRVVEDDDWSSSSSSSISPPPHRRRRRSHQRPAPAPNPNHRSFNVRTSDHRSNEHHILDPYSVNGLHRARSQGHGRIPSIHIHNDMMQENLQPRPRPEAPRGRRGHHEEVEAPAIQVSPPIEVPPDHRSRSRSDVAYYRNNRGTSPYELEYRMRKFEEEEQEREIQKREERAVEDAQRRRDAEAQERIDIAEQVKLEREREERERKEQFERMKLEEEKKMAAEKKKREDAIKAWQMEEDEKKKKAKEQEEEYERKRLAMIADEKAKKEKERKEYMERVQRDLARFGLNDDQVDYMLNHEERKKKDEEREYELWREHRDRHGNSLVHARHRSHSHGHAHHGRQRHSIGGGHQLVLGHRPVYPKIRREDIAIETLKYYEVPWEYDRADEDFIIILKEMTEKDTDRLFEHTRKLRSRKTLMLEERPGKDKPEYQWIRKRSHSRGKSPAARSPRRERFAEKILGI